MRQAEIYRKEVLAGTLTEDGGEYRFCYDEAYLAQKDLSRQRGFLPFKCQEPGDTTPLFSRHGS